MDLSTQQQIFEQLNKAKKILIALPKDLHADNVGSALALAIFLKKMDKVADVVTAGTLPEAINFLPESGSLKHTIINSKSFIITLNTKEKELDEISYQAETGSFNIFVKSKTGSFSEPDVTFGQDKFSYDVIVLIGCKSLQDLGSLFEDNAEVFYEAPKINIDNNPANEYFGAINLIDINTAAVSEIVFSLFSEFEKGFMDADIATCLLAGIITKTNSFQHVQTTPNAFLRASELVNLGGRQQEVVRYLYKTKSLGLLKLWGRALARLKIEENNSAVYSTLNLSDFEKAGASEADLLLVLKELIENISSYNIVAIITEQSSGGSRLVIAMHALVPWQALLEALNVEGKPTEPFPLAVSVLDITLPNLGLVEAEHAFVRATQSLPVKTV